MASRKSVASVIIFVGSTLCFFLPFVTVSCIGVKAFTLSGQQLATGTTLTQPQLFGPPQTQKVPADPFAAVAGLCALAGIALSLAGQRLAVGTAVSGGVGAISLLITRSHMESQIQQQGQGMVQLSFEAGYTIAILLLLAGVGWNIYLLQKARRGSAAITPVLDGAAATLGQASSESHASPHCSQCGKAVRAGARFCESCGNPT